MNATVLLIEDDPNIQEFLAVALARENYQLVIANSGMEALMQLQEATIDLVLLDLGLPDIDGLALLFQQIGKVVTYQKLMATIWGPYSNESQALRVNMSNLRKKLETDTLQPEYLITEIGVGYRLRDHR